jgi:hypothetical protein
MKTSKIKEHTRRLSNAAKVVRSEMAIIVAQHREMYQALKQIASITGCLTQGCACCTPLDDPDVMEYCEQGVAKMVLANVER